MNGHWSRLPLLDLHSLTRGVMLEASHNIDGYAPGWDFNHRSAGRLKVVSFKPGLAAVVAIIGMHPRIARRIGAPVFPYDRDSGCSFSATITGYGDLEATHRNHPLSIL